MDIESIVTEQTGSKSREECARRIAVESGVGEMTVKRVFTGRSVSAASARKIAAALHRVWGIEISAGDLAIGTAGGE